MRFARRVGSAGSALLSLCAAAAAQTANGPEFQVNTYTTNHQQAPRIAVDANGHFVVVWSGAGQGDRSGVFAKRYRSSGEPLGAEFLVNSTTIGLPQQPAVGVDALGGFVVAWRNNASGVSARRFGPDGMPATPDVEVNANPAPLAPSLAVHGDGSFVVAWENTVYNPYLQTTYYNRSVRRFDGAGGALGPAVPVGGLSLRNGIEVRGRGDESFVVAWSGSQVDDIFAILGQRFDSNGAAVGAEFRVNEATTGVQSRPTLAVGSDDGFLVGWHHDETGLGDIAARRFDADGNAIGLEFIVNSYVTGDQHSPSVAADAAGRFLVAWSSPSAGGVQARMVVAGTPVGLEFEVGTQPGTAPAVAGRGPGDFVVVWRNNTGQDGDGYGVFGQRFGDLIFADGFTWGASGP